MKPLREMSQGELAAFVDQHLQQRDIEVVLSGGAAVAIYSMNRYVSKDIDLVARDSLDHAAVQAAMEELGFERRGRYYHHKDSDFFVDFVSGSPSVGREPLRDIREVSFETGSVLDHLTHRLC